VLHHEAGTPIQEARRRRREASAAAPGAPLTPVYANEALSAFSIVR
jgi:hypothetical protein